MNPNTSTMLKPADLAARWHTSTGRLGNLRSAQRGPAHVKIGQSVRYRIADIEAYEAANTVQPVVA